MAKVKYDLSKEFEISRYVKNYYPDLSCPAFSVYQSMRFMEAEKFGYCKPVCIGYRDIAKIARLAIGTVKKAIIELQANRLLKVEIGKPGTKSKSKATKLTRIPIEQLKDHTLEGDTIHVQFARALKAKGVFLDGQRCLPEWTVKATNRIYTSKPNIQGIKKSEKTERLSTGATAGSVLISCDYKAAEPTAIKALLKFDSKIDLYAEVMKVTRWDKSTAKTETNKLAYCRNTFYNFDNWPDEARKNQILKSYVQLLSEYKEKLAADAKTKRFVKTLGGSVIDFPTRIRPHAGQTFNWKIQGTIADLIASAGFELIQDKSVSSMVYLHDELIILFSPCEKTEKQLSDYVQRVMQRAAQKLNLPLSTSVKATSI